MKEPELKASLDALAEVLMYPWWTNPRFQVFYKCVNGLYKALEKYHKFLANQQERTNQNHASPTPVRSLNDNWSLKSIEGQYLKHHHKVKVLNSKGQNNGTMYVSSKKFQYKEGLKISLIYK